MGWFKKIFKAVTKVVNTVAKTVVNTVQAVIANPLPVIAQIAGAAVGIPPAVTAAAITAVQGGSLSDVAKSAAGAYIASSATTAMPSAVSSASSSVGQSVTASLAETVSQSTAQAIGQATTAAINQGIVGGVQAGLTGGNVAQGITSGAVSGAVASGTGSVFTQVQNDPNWGLTPAATKVVAGATSAAITAEALGQDSSQAVANYVANTAVGTATSAAKTALSSTEIAQDIKNTLSSVFSPTTVAANKPTPQQIEAQVAKTPEEQINNLVQQTTGREATPEEVASLLGSMITKEQTSPTPSTTLSQVAGPMQPVTDAGTVNVAGAPKFKESLPPDYKPPEGMRVLSGTEADLTAAKDFKATFDPKLNDYVWLAPVPQYGEITQPLQTLEVPASQAIPMVATDQPVTEKSDITVDPTYYAVNPIKSPLSSVSAPAATVAPTIPTTEPTQSPLQQIIAQTPVEAPVATPASTPVAVEPTSGLGNYLQGEFAGYYPSGSSSASSGTSGSSMGTSGASGSSSAKEDLPSLSNGTVTAPPEEPIAPLSDLPTTEVASRPVASVTAPTAPITVAPTVFRSNAKSNLSTDPSVTESTSSNLSGNSPTGLPNSFLTTTETKDKFQSPLEAFLQLQNQNPIAPNANSQVINQPSQIQPMNEYYSYGSEPSMDDIFGFPASGYPMMASGGLTGTRYGKYAGGGMPTPMMASGGKMRVDFRHGDAVTGAGDGQSDDIPAMLADGEFVFPADVVAAIGNGSTKAGSDKLYDMMHGIRAHVRSAKPQDLPPEIKSPLQFLKTKPSKARR